MYEIAPMPVRTVLLFEETEARFGFVARIGNGVAAQLLRTMGELALGAVGTEPVQTEVFA
jgi:hypothetical protein